MAKKADPNDNEQFRSNLLAVVSHELNTPLTAILGAITVLESKFPKEQEYVPMLRRNAERLKKTVENLMEVSRADAGAMRVRLGEVDLANFLHLQAEKMISTLSRERFTLELEVEDELPHVCADSRRLAHVFDTLLRNAVKFSDLGKLPKGENASIHVKLSLEPISSIPAELLSTKEKKTGMYLVVSMASSLPSLGDSPEHFEQLFEPFSPWRDADTRTHEGLGVELAITKEILFAHDGYIWATFPSADKREPWAFRFALPILSREDELDLVVANRIHTGVGILGKLALLLIRTEPGTAISAAERLAIAREAQRALFRASDSVFWLEDAEELVVLLDDCDAVAAARVGQRILQAVTAKKPQLRLLWSTAVGPEDGANAPELLEKARLGWQPLDKA